MLQWDPFSTHSLTAIKEYFWSFVEWGSTFKSGLKTDRFLMKNHQKVDGFAYGHHLWWLDPPWDPKKGVQGGVHDPPLWGGSFWTPFYHSTSLEKGVQKASKSGQKVTFQPLFSPNPRGLVRKPPILVGIPIWKLPEVFKMGGGTPKKGVPPPFSMGLGLFWMGLALFFMIFDPLKGSLPWSSSIRSYKA